MFGAVKKKHKTVYTQAVKIGASSTTRPRMSVTINLAKPHKGAAKVTIDGVIDAVDGASADDRLLGDHQVAVPYGTLAGRRELHA